MSNTTRHITDMRLWLARILMGSKSGGRRLGEHGSHMRCNKTCRAVFNNEAKEASAALDIPPIHALTTFIRRLKV